MKILGITGGIACGKSFVTRLFREWGAWTASADEDARAVVLPGSTVLAAVFTQFPGVETSDGNLDRSKLGQHVFGNADARSRLEAILHPAIFERMEKAIAAARQSDEAPLFAYEVPLLFEKKREPHFDATLAVVCSPETQAWRLQERERIAGRSPLTDAQIAERLAAQMSNAEKARRATYVVRTDGTEAETEAQARVVWKAISGTPAPIAGSESIENTV